MKIEDYGNREDKTKIEICKLLRTLSEQLRDIVGTIEDIEKTIYNEEYEE